ncbi:hypothetical protein IWX92DRAFT_372533, partial [Phyllosticta citricarpa]
MRRGYVVVVVYFLLSRVECPLSTEGQHETREWEQREAAVHSPFGSLSALWTCATTGSSWNTDLLTPLHIFQRGGASDV